MITKKPNFRCSTAKAIGELALELDLPENTQDWEYIVGKPNDIEKYIHHYGTLSDDDKKFTLMEVIIQATTDQRNIDDFNKYWTIIKPLLEDNFSIHEYSIFYWCCFGYEECWTITPNMRKLWDSK